MGPRWAGHTAEKLISKTVPHSVVPKIDEILRICAALCNLCGDVISDVEDE